MSATREPKITDSMEALEEEALKKEALKYVTYFDLEKALACESERQKWLDIWDKDEMS